MKVFNYEEKQELITCIEKGGQLIKISNYSKELAEILKCGETGDFIVIGSLSEEISIKLFELYCDQTPMGYHLLGLKTCIDNFC